jgi:hypothetical protein
MFIDPHLKIQLLFDFSGAQYKLGELSGGTTNVPIASKRGGFRPDLAILSKML